jgi:DNA-binding transcriptional ArsR family regulator
MARQLAREAGNTGHRRGSFDANGKVDMEKLVVIARAVACPTRLAVLRVLGEKGCSVTMAAHRVGLAISTTAFHLDHLVRAGLVTKSPRGREAIYKWSRSRWALSRMSSPAPTMPVEEGPP